MKQRTIPSPSPHLPAYRCSVASSPSGCTKSWEEQYLPAAKEASRLSPGPSSRQDSIVLDLVEKQTLNEPTAYTLLYCIARKHHRAPGRTFGASRQRSDCRVFQYQENTIEHRGKVAHQDYQGRPEPKSNPQGRHPGAPGDEGAEGNDSPLLSAVGHPQSNNRVTAPGCCPLKSGQQLASFNRTLPLFQRLAGKTAPPYPFPSLTRSKILTRNRLPF